MSSQEQKIDWLYQLKRKMLLSILGVLTVTIVVTMVFIAVKLRDTLVNDSKIRTKELAVTIDSSLHHLMILRAPDAIQKTLEKIVEENEAVSQVFILNNQSKVTYSSNKEAIGTSIDQYEEESCSVCHTLAGTAPETDAIVLAADNETHRNISLIYNEADCYECHGSTAAINGKLIIDRSLESTYSLISGIELILISSGLLSLIVLVPLFSKLLSRGIDQYILEISTRNEELRLLYVMVESLSKTLDMELLKGIVIDIFKDILAADEMVLVLARGQHDYSASIWTSASGKIERKKISENDTENEVVQGWLDGKLNATKVSEDVKEICMPIEKGGQRLALVVARKGDGKFDQVRLNLGAVISSHIAVAFDNARLYHIAITDELTKTFTKRHFRQCIDHSFADYQKYGNKFALLMMDLDKFKLVNDNHGHVVGDAVLQRLGEILCHSVRENDLVFRYGGEEFTVILPATDAKGALYVAERIRAATEVAVFEPGTIDLKLTISVGVATCPDAPTVHDLIVDADQVLYAAKHQGRNRVILSDKAYESS
ncbi:MAG: diguanylate cyclase [Desulfuromonadales bacterium]|nr:diguanylate cyclase [Desulfuromonadales bacterium]